MKGRLSLALEVCSTLLVSAVAIVMLVIFLLGRSDRSPSIALEDHALRFSSDWRDWEESANRLGPDDASVVVSVFIDFTCPFCRDLVPVLDSLMSEFPGQLAVDFHPFPLSGHAFSLQSAVAAECAASQGVWGQMARTLFLQMDSIGSKEWGALARDAGVPDPNGFGECISYPLEEFDRIVESRVLGARIGVTGTPKLWINGVLFRGRRTLSELKRSVRKLEG